MEIDHKLVEHEGPSPGKPREASKSKQNLRFVHTHIRRPRANEHRFCRMRKGLYRELAKCINEWPRWKRPRKTHKAEGRQSSTIKVHKAGRHRRALKKALHGGEQKHQVHMTRAKGGKKRLAIGEIATPRGGTAQTEKVQKDCESRHRDSEKPTIKQGATCASGSGCHS